MGQNNHHILEINFQIYLPFSKSLKDKRSVLKSLIQRFQNKFQLSISETGNNEKLQLGNLTIVIVNSDIKFLDNIRQKIENFLFEEMFGKGEIINFSYNFIK